MKKLSAILALGLILSLTGCMDDSYKSVRHPENAETEVVEEAKPKEKEEKTENSENEKETKANGEENVSDQVKEELAEGLEFKVADTVNMRLAPSVNSAVVGQASPDDEILNLGETEGWNRVTVNGKTGYIRSDLLIKK
ncbi:SH3 domain-containing protein [uncultured Anaerococcus sp.]|uniref:SH3 domain-containing protein n=1 Tax=uncultured Anaerococcus sp. TaxID=293428 RepID=UPI002889B600|nr:SH3 domain-containing protein [uncultured Anaerococcus sp.]